jgi:hypothetical protein
MFIEILTAEWNQVIPKDKATQGALRIKTWCC